MLSHGLPSFKSLVLFCCVLSLKEALKVKSHYRSHCSIIGSLLNSVCQLSETVVTIGHHPHMSIDRILNKLTFYHPKPGAVCKLNYCLSTAIHCIVIVLNDVTSKSCEQRLITKEHIRSNAYKFNSSV